MSLIELLIVVAISAIIMIALLSLYMAGQRYFFNEDAKADAIEDSRMPMTWISRDVREALQVIATHGAYTTDANTIVLEVPSIDPGTGSLMTGSQDYIIYRRDPAAPERLERIIDAAEGTGRQDDMRVMADAVNAFGLIYYLQDGITPGLDDHRHVHRRRDPFLDEEGHPAGKPALRGSFDHPDQAPEQSRDLIRLKREKRIDSDN